MLREPIAWPDTPTSRRFQGGLATAPASSTSRPPPRTARRDPRGPPALAASARPRPEAGWRYGSRPGAMGEPPAPATRRRHTGAGLLRPCATGARVPEGTVGLAQRSCRPDHVSRLALFLSLSWRHARRTTESRHTLTEPHPTPDDAPRLGATPAQGCLCLLAWAGVSVVLPPAPLAPNARLQAPPVAELGRDKARCLWVRFLIPPV